MSDFIINPENGKTLSIFSREGKRVLGNYLWTLKQMGGFRKRRSRKCRSCGKKYRCRRQYGGAVAEGSSGGGGGSGGGGSGSVSLDTQHNNMINVVIARDAAVSLSGSRGMVWNPTARVDMLGYGAPIGSDRLNKLWFMGQKDFPGFWEAVRDGKQRMKRRKKLVAAAMEASAELNPSLEAAVRKWGLEAVLDTPISKVELIISDEDKPELGEIIYKGSLKDGLFHGQGKLEYTDDDGKKIVYPIDTWWMGNPIWRGCGVARGGDEIWMEVPTYDDFRLFANTRDDIFVDFVTQLPPPPQRRDRSRSFDEKHVPLSSSGDGW